MLSSPRQRGLILLTVGGILLGIGLSLSLYSVPVDSDGFHLFPFILPSDTRIYSFTLLQSPLVPLLYIFAAALVTFGWAEWRRSVTPLWILAFALILFSLIFGSVVSAVIDFPLNLGGTTFHISPFWLYFQGPLLLGFSVGVFSFVFRWTNRRQPESPLPNTSASA